MTLSLGRLQKKYTVLYVDPPWRFLTYSKKGRKKSADNHYRTMTFPQIVNLPIKNICNDDSVLLLWTTDPFLEKSFEVVNAWGFQYKTMGFVWAKKNKVADSFFKGLGYWTRANPEYCLLATRGKPKRKSGNVDTLVIDRLREHSRKPDQIYNRIEELVDGPYLELFARTSRPGWDSWGNEVGKFDKEVS